MPPGVKRVVYASFMLSFLLTFLAQHAGARGSYVPLSYAGAGYQFLPIGLPQPYTSWAITGMAVAYAASLLTAGVLLARRAALRDLLPAGLLALSQALWFSAPLLARHFGLLQGVEPFGTSFDTFYFMWIAIGHSVQYVWVTSYYARAGEGWTGLQPYLWKALLAGAVVWTLPVILFAPTLLGRLSFDAGLGLLVASAVNLHHFVLDGAIWKLRDGRVARILLRPRAATGPQEGQAAGSRWLSRLVWTLGAVCLAVLVVVKWEALAVPRALERGDLLRAMQGVRRLRWAGHDGAKVRQALGDELARRGSTKRAEREYERAIAFHPASGTWYRLGSMYAKEERWDDALAAYEAGLVLDPDEAALHHEIGTVWLKLDRPDKAREAFARADALDPEQGIHRLMLERTDRLLEESRAATPDTGS
jgi:tetratricopeptide (TPR) repeat protein